MSAFQRVPDPGQGMVTLPRSGRYIVYYEFGPNAVVTSGHYPAVQISTRPAVPLKLTPYTGRLTYRFKSDSGVAVATLSITRPGTYLTYVTSLNAPAETDIAIGQSLIADSNGVPTSSWILMITGLGGVIAFFILHAWWGRLHAWWRRPR